MKSNSEFLNSCVFFGVLAASYISVVGATESISCYSCNSAFDPRCGDPFDPYSIGIVNCSLLPPLENLPSLQPILCRKTRMKIRGHERIVRGCGYIESEDLATNKTCVRRTGTSEVEVIYCSCKGSLCNAANTMDLHSLSLVILISSFIVIVNSINQ